MPRTSFAEVLDNDMGAIFIQPDGPNGDTYWLGCHDMGDDSGQSRDTLRTFCPDPSGRGRHMVALRTQGQRAEGTFDITFPVGKTADWLEVLDRRNCTVPVYVQQSECGERNVFNNYDRGIVYEDTLISAGTRTGLASRNPDGAPAGESMRTFTFTYMTAVDYFSLVETRWAIIATEALLGVATVGRDRCRGACGPAQEVCEHLICSDTSAVAQETIIYWSDDFGHTWTASAADPFAVAEDAGPLAAVPIDKSTMRAFAACSITVAATPARIAYTDDSGASWTLVTVGSTNTEWINDIAAWSAEAIWVCTDTGGGAAGNVYFSADAGVTWTIQLTGATDSLNALDAASRYQVLTVGDTNEIQWTADGGAHWTAITGPAAQAAADALSCGVLDEYNWWVGYDDGEVWYTQDGGDNWAERDLPLPEGATAITDIRDIAVIDSYCFWICGTATVGGNPFGVVGRTINGGRNWEYWLAPATGAVVGMNSMIACDYNRAFAVGDVVAGTGLVMEVAEIVG